jgi:hypothetical protein
MQYDLSALMQQQAECRSDKVGGAVGGIGTCLHLEANPTTGAQQKTSDTGSAQQKAITRSLPGAPRYVGIIEMRRNLGPAHDHIGALSFASGARAR